MWITNADKDFMVNLDKCESVCIKPIENSLKVYIYFTTTNDTVIFECKDRKIGTEILNSILVTAKEYPKDIAIIDDNGVWYE